jgi:hypothetical protein
VLSLLEWLIPGWVILLVVVAGYELLRQKRRKSTGTPLSKTYVDEFTAMLYGTKRLELEHRDSMSMMRDEDRQGAPPTHDVDLERGIVVLRPDELGPQQAIEPDKHNPAPPTNTTH